MVALCGNGGLRVVRAAPTTGYASAAYAEPVTCCVWSLLRALWRYCALQRGRCREANPTRAHHVSEGQIPSIGVVPRTDRYRRSSAPEAAAARRGDA